MQQTLSIIINSPKDGDERNFEEYEDSILYEWINDVSLIEDFDEARHYEMNGSYDTNGDIAALIYGFDNNLEGYEGQGFMLQKIIADERVLNSGELANVWLAAFVHYIYAKPNGPLHDDQGNIVRKKINGEVIYKRKYHYFWFATPVDANVVFDVSNYENLIINELKYYVLRLRRICKISLASYPKTGVPTDILQNAECRWGHHFFTNYIM